MFPFGKVGYKESHNLRKNSIIGIMVHTPFECSLKFVLKFIKHIILQDKGSIIY